MTTIFYFYRKSATCTHVSAVLHALVAMTTSGSQLRLQPTCTTASTVQSDDEEEVMPVTSYLCQWKVPKKRKDSSLPMSAAIFQKHDFQKQKKRSISLTEDFDPRPVEYRGNANSLLPALLDSVRGESLRVSLLFDPQYCHQSTPQSPPNILDTLKLKETVATFKANLKLPSERLREIEQNTREQRHSELWFSVRRYRITASRFGEILRRKPTTRPDALVLSILQPRSFSSDATDWGIQNESSAIQAYLTYHRLQGNDSITVGPCGFLVSETHPFLGATPDGTIYDPLNFNQPFGFLEVKCPYSHRNRTSIEASSFPGFCCTSHLVSQTNTQVLQLRQNHIYYAQVQGQMAVGGRMWCDFVIFTTKGISVERITYDDNYWHRTLLPKLEAFFDNCLGPEIVSPIHALGLPIRDLSNV